MKSDSGQDNVSRRSLVEGEDFYVENGLMVLTARFLLERGYCCENGCRHCPYSNPPEGSIEDELRSHSE